MHVRVDASVVSELGEVAVPGVDEHSRLGVEEPLVPNGDSLAEQVASAGQAGNSGRGGAQHDECVRITGFLVRTLAKVVNTAEPAATRFVTQPAGKTSQRLGRQIGIAGSPQQVAQSIDMEHPSGDVGIDRPRQVRLTSRVEPRGTAERMRKVPAEIEQSVALGLEHRGGNPVIW